MKRLVTLFSCLLTGSILYSQGLAEQQITEFWGFRFGSSLGQVLPELKKKTNTSISKYKTKAPWLKDSTTVLLVEGTTFGNYPADVYLSFNQVKLIAGSAYFITNNNLALPEQKWAVISNQFEALRRNIIAKYGNPTKEQSTSLLESYTPQQLMNAITGDSHLYYYSEWEKGGRITLEVTSNLDIGLAYQSQQSLKTSRGWMNKTYKSDF